MKWTKLSCGAFKNNQARLQLFALVYNLGDFLRRLAVLPITRPTAYPVRIESTY